ncbi:uncharacterized protein VTP21DRAFT_4024 [Calcarisporiella thermophila]|uniref:uncharacterized protein n=1 Tax=Calcarisporiella thermophila TaxID=911321 RepID=UPI003742977C
MPSILRDPSLLCPSLLSYRYEMVEPIPSTSSAALNEEPFTLHIRFAEGGDLSLSVRSTDTVSQLKEKVQRARPALSGKYLRFVYQGRLLRDAETLEQTGVSKRDMSLPIYIHCSASDSPPSRTSESQIRQITPLTGFDRLREAGFSEEDIRNIRTQFHQLHGTSVNGEINEQTLNMEEDWIENAGETLPDGTVQGAYYDMVIGLLFGFFMGLIVLFWFKEQAFSRRQQMGIVAGLLINISFGILRVYYY